MNSPSKIDAKDITPEHYRYGGSTADRTLGCNGWRALADTYPEKKVGKAANDGTVCHEACEMLTLDENLDYDDLLDKDIECEGSVITEDLIDNKIIPAFEAKNELMDKYNVVKEYAELKGQINSLIGGTADIVAIAGDKTTLIVGDYKFGDGVMVYAEDNKQALFYAWILFDLIAKDYPEIDTIVLAIIQPSDRRESYLDEVTVKADAVFDFEEDFFKAFDIAEGSKPGENLASGSHCKFCPCEHTCPEKIGKAKKALDIDILEESFSPVNDPDMVQLIEAIELANELKSWSANVLKYAHNQIELGNDIPGYKLVAKQGTRKWIDEEEVTKYLKRKLKTANAMTSKVISPAQAEKVAKKLGIAVDLEKRIHKASSGTNLVPESAKGESIISDTVLSAQFAAAVAEM